MKKIMLLGSGELGKEFTIAAKRAGQYLAQNTESSQGIIA